MKTNLTHKVLLLCIYFFSKFHGAKCDHDNVTTTNGPSVLLLQNHSHVHRELNGDEDVILHSDNVSTLVPHDDKNSSATTKTTTTTSSQTKEKSNTSINVSFLFPLLSLGCAIWAIGKHAGSCCSDESVVDDTVTEKMEHVQDKKDNDNGRGRPQDIELQEIIGSTHRKNPFQHSYDDPLDWLAEFHPSDVSDMADTENSYSTMDTESNATPYIFLKRKG